MNATLLEGHSAFLPALTNETFETARVPTGPACMLGLTWRVRLVRGEGRGVST